MKLYLSFALIFFGAGIAYSQSPTKVEIPRTENVDSIRRNLVVTIDSKQNFFLGTKKIKAEHLDSVLTSEIRALKLQSYTPAVIINADSSAVFKDVFRVVQIAKKDSVRVFFNVKQ